MENTSEKGGTGRVFNFQKSWAAAVALMALCALVPALTTGCAHYGLKDTPRMTSFRVDPDGNVVGKAGIRQVGFWTPSADTENSLSDFYGGQANIPEDDRWEVIDSEDPVAEFGEYLVKELGDDLAGYRRHKVVGRGRTLVKSGWWWIVSVKEGAGAEKINRIYRTFWKNSGSIYFESVDAEAASD